MGSSFLNQFSVSDNILKFVKCCFIFSRFPVRMEVDRLQKPKESTAMLKSTAAALESNYHW